MKKYFEVGVVLGAIERLRSDPALTAGLDAARKIIEEGRDEFGGTRGVYECFHCGSLGVVWDSDFDFEDYGFDGEGIVHECHCANCGASITYVVGVGEDGEDE